MTDGKPAPTPRGLFIGFADALSKLSWSHAEPPAALPQTITVVAARNEVVGAQVRLTASEDFVLTVDHANWLHPLGFCPRVRLDVSFPTLPAGAVEVLPVGYLPGDDGRLWMEYLDRAGYAEVRAYRPQAVYLRVRIPADLPPGVHTGTVRAFAQYGFDDETSIWQGEVRLEVAAATLPDVADWSFHLNLWQHATAVARQHRAPLWSDAHFALLDRYFTSLAQLGQKAVSVMAAEIPWSGQRCYRDRLYPSYLFEHAVVDVSRDAAGHLRCDFTHLDRLLALAAAHGMDREIEVFGLLNVWQDEAFGFGKVAPDAPDAVRVRCHNEATGGIEYLRTGAELRWFVGALADHFAALGVLDRVRIAADEPSDLPAFRRNVAFLQEAAPDLKHKAYINHFEFLEDAPPGVIDAVPVLPLACRNPELTAQLTARLHATGGRMLWYVCCWPPFPNTFLHSPLVEGELHGWLTYYLGLDGFERWAFCLWPADPWHKPSFRAPGWSAGDMFFVLPGPDGAPVETLRYEALRAAVQDYELLKLAERTLPAEDAQALFKAAFAHILRADSIADFAEVGAPAGAVKAEDLYSLDPADYRAARRVVLDRLK
jgi:hypothetical protein